MHDLFRTGMPVLTIVALTAIGYAAACLFDAPRRSMLAPALPALGLTVSVVFLHWTSLLVGTEVGAWLLVGAAASVVGVTAVVRPDHLTLERRALAKFGVALALGALPLIVGLQPSFRLDSASIVHPTDNHDSFFYVSSAAWLRDHPGTDRPSIGTTPSDSRDVPADFPALSTYDDGFRLGEPLLQSSISSVSGRPLASFWYDVTAGWLALVPGGAMVLAAVLRRRWWVGAAAGVVCSLSAFALFQVLNQNGPSVLALSILPFVLAVILKLADQTERWLSPELALATVGLAGFVGVYPELSTLVALPVLCILMTSAAPLKRRIGTVVSLVGAVVVIAPYAVYNAVRLIRNLSGANPDWERHAFTSGARLAIQRASGVLGLSETGSRWTAAVEVIVVILSGLLLCGLVPRLRVLVVALCVSGAAIFALQFRHRDNYSLERLAMVGQPLILLFAAFGLGCLVERWIAPVEPRTRTGTVRLGVLLVTVATVATVAIQVQTQIRLTPPRAALGLESVKPEVLEVARWVRSIAGENGIQATVLTDSYVDRLWIADALRSESDVSYPYLTPDYFGTRTFADPRLTRYVVVSADTFTNAPRSALIRSNGLYSMYDLQGVQAWFALPVRGFYPVEPQDAGSALVWMPAGGTLLVMRTAANVNVDLSAYTNRKINGSLQAVTKIGAAEVARSTIGPIPSPLNIPLAGSQLIWEVDIESDRPGVALTSADTRAATMAILGPIRG